MSLILSVAIKYEHDVVAARQRARQIAGLLGFDSQDQTRIATAVSEIARNAFTYAGGGRVEFAVEGRTAPQLFTVKVLDHGPGIADLSKILSGRYTSATGMGALYAELDEKADHLRRADDMKTRFLSNMSHEFRTPLNSIQALTRLLLERSDGGLTSEQTRQVEFIRKAAQDLTELVNDLLDLAKVEAGKIVVRPIEFEVANLFGALRGMLRPLLVNESVALVFEDTSSVPTLFQDEGKVSQILRNFISNALKFTERGEVRVSATVVDDDTAVAFSVADTGIGIA